MSALLLVEVVLVHKKVTILLLYTREPLLISRQLGTNITEAKNDYENPANFIGSFLLMVMKCSEITFSFDIHHEN